MTSIDDRRLTASMLLAADPEAWGALANGVPVPRERLRPEMLQRLGEPLEGDPMLMTEELALRVEVARSRRLPSENGSVPDAEPAWRPMPILEAATRAPPAAPEHGRGLIYGHGAATILSGEPGVGKSMVLAAVVADAAQAGQTSLYLDFERTAALLLERLQAAGLGEHKLGRIHYLRPTSATSAEGIRAMVEHLAPALVILDSYDAALALFGFEPTNEGLRVFAARMIEPLRSGGAALVAADHVAKDRERRGRYSIGGQAKLALAEAHLGLSAITALRRGSEGKLKVTILKDTYGHLPAAAVFTLRSHEATGTLSWEVRPAEGDPDGGDNFRPTVLMERVSRQLEIAGEPLSGADLERDVKGKRDYIRQAVAVLVREGFAKQTAGPRGARLVRLLKPYREADE